MGKYFFLVYYYIGKDFSAFGSQKSSQLSVLLLLGNKIGQCKTQTTDYCFHQANEYVATKVPSFSNTKNNSPQSAFYTALKQNLAPQPSLATIVKKRPLLSRQCCHNNVFCSKKGYIYARVRILEMTFVGNIFFQTKWSGPHNCSQQVLGNKILSTEHRGPGAHFSKVPIINRPGKLSPFTLMIEVSVVLHLRW